MPIAGHFVNKPTADVHRKYEQVWARLAELGLRHPEGRLSHTAWVVGTELHVVDLWESQEQLDAFFNGTLRELLVEVDFDFGRPPEIGDVLQIVTPPVHAQA